MATTTSLGFRISSSWDGSGTRNARKDITNVGEIAKGVGKIIGVAMAVAGGAVASWGVEAVKAGVKSNILMQTTRKGLTNLLGSAEKAEEQIKKLREFGKESPISFPVWVAAQQQMIAFGVETEKVVPLLGSIEDAVLASGGGVENIERVVEVMSRMSSSAEITKGDLNSLGTEGVNAAKIVAKEFGVTEAQMREMHTSGEVSVEDFYAAFTTGVDDMFGDVSGGIRDTMTGAIDRVKGAQRRIGEILATPFVDPMGGGAAVVAANALADALNKVEDALEPLAEAWSESMTDRADKFASAMQGISDAITPEKVQGVIDKFIQFLPLIGSVGAALFAHFGAGALGALGFGRIAAGINPISVAIVTLIALSPELRGAFGELLQAFMPLLPVALELANIFANILMQVLPIVAGAISGVAKAIGWLTGDSTRLNIVLGVVYTVLAVKAAIWAATTIGAMAKVIAAKTMLMARTVLWGVITAGAFVISSAGWIKAAAIAMASAIRMAAAWLIALGPIGIVIAVIIAVVALIILNWDKVKNVTIIVWNAIVSFFKTVWNAISSVVSTVWNFIFNLLVGGWKALWSFLGPLLRHIGNFFSKIFNGIRAVITAVWNFISPFLMRIWNGLKTAASAIFRAIGAVFNWLKNNIWNPFVDVIKSGVDKIKGFWNGLKNAAATIFRGIKNTVEWFRDKFDAVKNKIGDFVDAIKSKWDGLKSTAKTVWNTIRDLVKKPIKFVIETIYNNGIRKFWNWIDDKLFDKKHQLAKVGGVSGWAQGGPVRGPGTWTSDSISARLSRGEHVWTAREVAAAGGHGAVMRMRSGVLGGRPVSAGPEDGTAAFKGGGWWSNLLDPLKGDPADVVPDANADFFVNVGELSKKLVGWTKTLWGDHKNIPGVSGFKDRLSDTVKKVIKQFLGMATSLSEMGMGGGPGDYKAMSAWIQSVVPGTSITSGFRPGDPGYHGKGQAIDMAFSDGSERRGGGKAEDAFLAIVGAWKSSIAELIWDYSPWGPSLGVWNGKRHTFGSASSGPGTHADHIHWASSTSAKGVGSGVEQWRHTVMSALRAAGLSTAPGIVDMVLQSIKQESGGNPMSVNNWDINAQNGIPSKGLNQVIQPTFNAYAGKYARRGIFDPFANIYASIMYAKARYGSGWAAKMAAPGGYSGGGALSFDNGGMLPMGYSMVHNGTGKPEPVGHDLVGKGGDVHIHFHDSVIANEKHAEDLFVKASKNAKKHGRKID